jgi:acyl-CoA thioester hydrolase
MKWIETEETVRFNEIDQWGIAWYGHYIAWFEAGRMALLKQVDLLPEQIVELGYIAPIIKLNCDFKKPATFGDRIIIRTTVVKPEIAALIFKFEVVRKKDNELLARGETTQVLLDLNNTMIYRITGELEKRIKHMIDFCASSEK